MKLKVLPLPLLLLTSLGIFFPLTFSSPPSDCFNVRSFGAKGDGLTNDTEAFLSMWNAGCQEATGDVEFLVQRAVYVVGPVKFRGPCKARSIFFNMQGHLKATTDLRDYEDAWIQFRELDNLTVDGGGNGTLNGQGWASWSFDKCPEIKNCKILPISLKFVRCTNTSLTNIKSVDSKFFHMGVLECHDFKASGLWIKAPEDSPNTDGIHIERSSNVKISSSVIRTGDDCISIGQGNSHITVSGIACGPGHGISVGSLGRYQNEKDVNQLIIRDSVLTGTQNGVRIKTWADSPQTSNASNMIFSNIVMNNVRNPIIIDQEYCPYLHCANRVPSSVKISDIVFKNIRGSSKSKIAVSIKCSKGVPCRNIKLHNIHLDIVGGFSGWSQCKNAQIRYSGTQIPPPCVTELKSI